MGLLDLFRRRAPIADLDALAHFIDQNAAFVVQKGMYEYSRARAGHYAKVLFADRGFQAAIEVSRWRAYPIGLAMVAEVVDGILRPYAGAARRQEHAALSALVLAIYDRYAVPAALDAQVWNEARGELERRLVLIGMHAPKLAKDIPEPMAEAYFGLMPIHEKLRGRDFQTTRNYLRVTLCNIHEEFTKRIDAPAVLRALDTPAG